VPRRAIHPDTAGDDAAPVPTYVTASTSGDKRDILAGLSEEWPSGEPQRGHCNTPPRISSDGELPMSLAQKSRGSLAGPEEPEVFSSRAGSVFSDARRHSLALVPRGVLPYVEIARPDHWIKNIFMALGVLLACFYHPEALRPGAALPVLWAVAATCLIASSNYVINEILDAPTDRSHPVKRRRPIPAGKVLLPVAYAEWLLLGAAGLVLASRLNRPFFFSGVFLLVMGLIYNVPPVRSKDHPYVDVLSESINNPIRLLLGWFAVTTADFPPVSLLLSYWMIGAFFMAAKRFAEYRSIADPEVAGAYRSSFRYYTEQRLLISMFFYATCFSLFLGVFIIRYHLELILTFPLVSGFICYYLNVSFKEDSATQSPEHLYREWGLMAYLVVCLVVFVALMLVNIPVLYELFNVNPSPISPLWKF
jgi:decaprenyl-phosphate phosphoribosyltransferase